jgi:hypothetical protein
MVFSLFLPDDLQDLKPENTSQTCSQTDGQVNRVEDAEMEEMTKKWHI